MKNVCENSKKKSFFGGGSGCGLQGGCERRIEVFCENYKNNIFFFFLGGGGSGGSGWGVRVDVNEELKVLGK